VFYNTIFKPRIKYPRHVSYIKKTEASQLTTIHLGMALNAMKPQFDGGGFR
jgi:hypothetical protein